MLEFRYYDQPNISYSFLFLGGILDAPSKYSAQSMDFISCRHFVTYGTSNELKVGYIIGQQQYYYLEITKGVKLSSCLFCKYISLVRNLCIYRFTFINIY